MSNTIVASQVPRSEARFFFGKNSISEEQKNILYSTILVGERLKKDLEIMCRLPLGSISSLVWTKKNFVISFIPEDRFPAKVAIARCDEAEDNIYKRYLFWKKVNNYVILCVGNRMSIPLERAVYNLAEALSSLPAKELMKHLENIKVDDKGERSKALHAGEGLCSDGCVGKACKNIKEGTKKPGQRSGKSRALREGLENIFISEGRSTNMHNEQYQAKPDLASSFRSLSEFPYFEWGNEHIKNIFLYQRMVQGRVSFSGIHLQDMSVIDHCDLECAYMDKHPDQNRHAYIFNIPENIKDYVVAESCKGQKVRPKFNAVSILYDDDIIHGGIERFQKYLEEIASAQKNENILVACGCTPIVIGDDVVSVIKKINKKNDNFFAYYDPRHQNNNAVMIYQKIVEEIMNSIPHKDPIPGSINIIGAPLCRAMEELLELIKKLKLTINCRILPNIGKETCENYYASSFQVFFPNADYANIYENVFKPLKMRSIKPEAPYGFDQTTKWLKAICAASGSPLSTVNEWKEYMSNIEVEWRTNVEKAKKYTIGVVLSYMDHEKIYEPEKNILSIPLIRFIEDMGFKLDILLYCDKDVFQAHKLKIAALMKNKNIHKIDYFEKNEQLKEWLARTESSCVYSDLASDKRLLKVGKEQFSMFDLEMGYEGALRSIKVLLKKCGTKFLPTYKDYFGMPLKVI